MALRVALEQVAGVSAGGVRVEGKTRLSPYPTSATPSTPRGAGRIDGESETFVAHALRAEGFDASEDGTGRGTPIVPVGFYPTGGTHGANACENVSPPVKVGSGVGIPSPPAIAYNLRGRDGGAMPEPTDVASVRSSSGGSSRTYVGVRRLTPTECERLQGFPDGFTAIDLAQHAANCAAIASDDDDAPCDCGYKSRPAKDGPRYRALGNSMAVPVMAWIGRRIANQL